MTIPTKIEIKESPGRGLGVFATKKILKDEIIEITPLIEVPNNLYALNDYLFFYPKGGQNRKHAVVLGYGSLYNHNNQNNADWRDGKPRTFEFFALKDIEPGEEIYISYGGPKYFKIRPINWL